MDSVDAGDAGGPVDDVDDVDDGAGGTVSDAPGPDQTSGSPESRAPGRQTPTAPPHECWFLGEGWTDVGSATRAGSPQVPVGQWRPHVPDPELERTFGARQPATASASGHATTKRPR